jgi:hypothetical protein
VSLFYAASYFLTFLVIEVEEDQLMRCANFIADLEQPGPLIARIPWNIHETETPVRKIVWACAFNRGLIRA